MNKRRLLITIGIVAVVVVLVIVFDTVLANHQPAIASLAAPERVIPSGSCQIVCNATDRDGDALSYNWSASAGELNGEGATVTWTAPDSVGSYNITVAVTDGRGEEVTKQMTVEVRPNRAPTISSLTADADWTLPSGTVQVTCTASDPDGDELSYEWTATGSTIPGTGAAVNWTPPQQVGIYNVTVVVKDGHGSSATKTMPMSVATEQPPTIEALLVTAEHCYLRTNTSPYRVGQGKNYDIQCAVADVGVQLSYDWSCDGGEVVDVSEDGSRVVWTAPNASGKVTITVIVSDIAGNKAVRNVLLEVASCTSCTFPGCSG
jgi:hypothetical protein